MLQEESQFSNFHPTGDLPEVYKYKRVPVSVLGAKN
jgi:hypothetical protein